MQALSPAKFLSRVPATSWPPGRRRNGGTGAGRVRLRASGAAARPRSASPMKASMASRPRTPIDGHRGRAVSSIFGRHGVIQACGSAGAFGHPPDFRVTRDPGGHLLSIGAGGGADGTIDRSCISRSTASPSRPNWISVDAVVAAPTRSAPRSAIIGDALAHASIAGELAQRSRRSTPPASPRRREFPALGHRRQLHLPRLSRIPGREVWQRRGAGMTAPPASLRGGERLLAPRFAETRLSWATCRVRARWTRSSPLRRTYRASVHQFWLHGLHRRACV